MSSVLTRNMNLRDSWKTLRRVEPESGTQWEKRYLPKTERDTRLYGWYHNSPFHNWNNKSFFAFRNRNFSETVLSQIFQVNKLSRFSKLISLSESVILQELSTSGPWTVFAPTNCYFDNLVGGWDGFCTTAVKSPAAVHRFLRGHVCAGIVSIGQMQESDSKIVNSGGVEINITTCGSFEDDDRRIIASAGNYTAELRRYNMPAKNGIVHLVDSALC